MALSTLCRRFSRICIGQPAAVRPALGGPRSIFARNASSASAASPLFAATAAIAPPEAPEKTTTGQTATRSGKVVARTQKFRTANFRVSPKKLNKLAQQIRGLPVDEAILQMHFSHKKPRMKIRNMLYNAKATAANVTKLNQDLLYVKEAFVGKGRYEKRMLIHGRARSALMTRKSAHMKILLEERTPEVQEQYIHRLMKQMLKHRAKRQSPNANLDLKPASNFALFSKEVRVREP